jgi:putative flavoprotein involved in K+ transport
LSLVHFPEALANTIGGKVGQAWGFSPDGEMSNMRKRTAQRGLWFAGGGFNNCRQYSRYLAMQIKAIEEGLLQWNGTLRLRRPAL